MDSDVFSLIEMNAVDDNCLLKQAPDEDLGALSCSALLISGSRRDPRLCQTAIIKQHNVSGEEASCSLPHGNKENLNASNNKLGLNNLSMEPQKMKKSRRAANLRKSLAWDKAFFTEEGVLSDSELSMICGTSSRLDGAELSVICEKRNERPVFSDKTPNAKTLKAKLVRQPSSSRLHKTIDGRSLSKPDSRGRAREALEIKMKHMPQKVKSGSNDASCSNTSGPDISSVMVHSSTNSRLPHRNKSGPSKAMSGAFSSAVPKCCDKTSEAVVSWHQNLDNKCSNGPAVHVQIGKPSGLRMPSPSLKFFSEAKLSLSNGSGQRNCHPPKLRKPGISSLLNQEDKSKINKLKLPPPVPVRIKEGMKDDVAQHEEVTLGSDDKLSVSAAIVCRPHDETMRHRKLIAERLALSDQDTAEKKNDGPQLLNKMEEKTCLKLERMDRKGHMSDSPGISREQDTNDTDMLLDSRNTEKVVLQSSCARFGPCADMPRKLLAATNENFAIFFETDLYGFSNMDNSDKTEVKIQDSFVREPSYENDASVDIVEVNHPSLGDGLSSLQSVPKVEGADVSTIRSAAGAKYTGQTSCSDLQSACMNLTEIDKSSCKSEVSFNANEGNDSPVKSFVTGSSFEQKVSGKVDAEAELLIKDEAMSDCSEVEIQSIYVDLVDTIGSEEWLNPNALLFPASHTTATCDTRAPLSSNDRHLIPARASIDEVVMVNKFKAMSPTEDLIMDSSKIDQEFEKAMIDNPLPMHSSHTMATCQTRVSCSSDYQHLSRVRASTTDLVGINGFKATSQMKESPMDSSKFDQEAEETTNPVPMESSHTIATCETRVSCSSDGGHLSSARASMGEIVRVNSFHAKSPTKDLLMDSSKIDQGFEEVMIENPFPMDSSCTTATCQRRVSCSSDDQHLSSARASVGEIVGVNDFKAISPIKYLPLDSSKSDREAEETMIDNLFTWETSVSSFSNAGHLSPATTSMGEIVKVNGSKAMSPTEELPVDYSEIDQEIEEANIDNQFTNSEMSYDETILLDQPMTSGVCEDLTTGSMVENNDKMSPSTEMQNLRARSISIDGTMEQTVDVGETTCHHEAHTTVRNESVKENIPDEWNKQRELMIKPPVNAIPFSEEWLAAIEAAGEEILSLKTGRVQNSPPSASSPEPGPWSPVKRKKHQTIGPFDCTKFTNPEH